MQELRERADIEGMETRHPDASLMRYLTQSARSYRAMLSRAGFEGFLQATDPAALPTAPPTTGEQFLEINWPDTAVSVHGVDVLQGSDRWYPLDPIDFNERRDYIHRPGPPRCFFVRAIPTTTPASTLTAGKIQIFPLNTQGLTHRVWYLAVFPELTDPGDVVDGFDGDAHEWILWDATIKIAAKDDDAQNVDQIALRERALIQERVTTNYNRVQRAGATSPRRTGYRRL
jgi:hypothetical protein